MPRYFLHSCSKIQARREKDLTSEMRLNSAKNVRLKKRDVDPGLYMVLIKGFGDGGKYQRGKKEKKRKFGENKTFGSTKS